MVEFFYILGTFEPEKGKKAGCVHLNLIGTHVRHFGPIYTIGLVLE